MKQGFVLQQVQHVAQVTLSHHMYFQLYGTPPEYIEGSIRITFGEHNTKDDVDFLINNLEKFIKELREKQNRNFVQNEWSELLN